jgi:predicted protein tyrosine phosphatase
MSLIVNANRQEIANGSTLGLDPDRTIVIQIVDPGSYFPQATAFVSRIQVQFDDTEEDVDSAIRPWQAELILSTLKAAKAHDLDVVVHCHAGLCRSGAVVEFALRHLDFQLHQNRERHPNQLVLRRLEAAHGIDRMQELREAFEGLGEDQTHTPGNVSINGFDFMLTCWACPEQYDVYWGDVQVAYVRLRYGRLTTYTPDVGGTLVYEHNFPGDDNEYLGQFPDEDSRTHHLTKIAEILNGTSVPTNQA